MIREETITTANGQPTSLPPINKADAVRAALASGLTSPREIVQHVKEDYGLDVSPNYVSVIKAGKQRQQPKQKYRKAALGRRQDATGQVHAVPTASFEVLEFREDTEQPVPRQSGKLTPEDLLTLASLAERAGGVEALQGFLSGLKRLQ